MRKEKVNSKGDMPRRVARRIMKRAAEGEKAVVVTIRKRQPSQVIGIDEYMKMKELPKKVKPWEHRQTNEGIPDPLGAVDIGVIMPLTREQMYE